MANSLSDDPFVIVTEKKLKSSKFAKIINKLKPPYSSFASRNVVAMAVVLMLVGSIGAGVFYLGNHTQLKPKAGGGGVQLSITPSQVNVAPHQTFTVDVNLNTADQKVAAAQVKINYDTNFMRLTNTELKTFLPNILTSPKTSTGAVTFTVASSPDSPKQGDGTIATLTFVAEKESNCSNCTDDVSSGSGTISFDSAETQIAALGLDTNAVGNLIPATVTIGDAVQTSTAPGNNLVAPYYKLVMGTWSNGQMPVKIYARTDTDAVNLFVVKLKYSSNIVVSSFDNTGSVVTNWASQSKDDSAHTLAIAGGIPTPGIKTSGSDVLVTTIIFGETSGIDAPGGDFTPYLLDTTFATDTSMYRNSDNVDILASSLDLAGRIVYYNNNNQPNPSPSSAPNPSGYSGKGDANGDGVINYQDLSILLSNWTRVGVVRTVPPAIDFNDDLKINTFDFSAMTNLLVQLGVIHRNS